MCLILFWARAELLNSRADFFDGIIRIGYNVVKVKNQKSNLKNANQKSKIKMQVKN